MGQILRALNFRITFWNLTMNILIYVVTLTSLLNTPLDTYNFCSINNPIARAKVIEIMEDLQLLDYYRILNPDKKVYTWRKKNPFKQSRLDYFLISDILSNLVENCTIKPRYRSDHSVVVLELRFNPFKRGRGLWKGLYAV